MNDIWAGLEAAFWLIVTLDADLVEITLRSLPVSAAKHAHVNVAAAQALEV